MLDAVKKVADYYWAIRLEELGRYAAEAVKFDERALTSAEIDALEAAKHYIELALKNDQYWKAEKAA